MYFIRPALRHQEGRCLCTSQGPRPLSDSEHVDFSPPNNFRKGNHITYLSKCVTHCFIRRQYHIFILQDHEARSFLFPSSPLSEQVPADQNGQLKASAQDHQRLSMTHKHHNTCMARNHVLMIYFYHYGYGMQVLWCYASHKIRLEKS